MMYTNTTIHAKAWSLQRPCDRLTSRNRGSALLLAMIFLAVFASLATAMAIVSQSNLHSADNYQHAQRALAAAETGIAFAQYRVSALAQNYLTDKGTIDDELAQTIWASVSQQFTDALADEAHYLGDGWVKLDGSADAPKFHVQLQQHPIDDEDYDAGYYQRAPYNADTDNPYTSDGAAVTADNPVAPQWIRLTVTGEARDIQRAISVDLRIDKKIRYALLSRNRIMIGRNVIIVGPVGSHFTNTDVMHGHPIQMRDNFHGLDSELDEWLDDFVDYLADNDYDGDNRVLLADTRESENLDDAESFDRNSDGYVDAYDFFVLKYDDDADGALTAEEFSAAGALIDAQLWQLVNEAKYPPGAEFNWADNTVKLPGSEDWIDASADLGVIDNDDDYAKIHGRVVFKADVADWEAGAADGPYQEYFRDGISPEPGDDPVTFSADSVMLASLGPDAFDVSGYADLAGGNFQDQVDSPVAHDGTPAYTPPGPATLESVPYQSPYPYDYYERPIYENMTFTDVTLPKGTNALFVNCKFVGVTFVDTEADNDDPNFNYAGMQNADGSLTYASVEAEVNGDTVSDTKPLANNVRFHDCTFEGIVVTESAESFSQTRNKLQFTGDTRFDIDAPSLSAEQQELFAKSTILAPQYSIDVGTFTEPNDAGEVTQLEGTIVAGVLDIRGQAVVNGAILSTYEPVPGQGPLVEGGNPANFNTTLGYFESVAGDSEAEMPGGGYGKIIIRYDPNRPMPDGITGPVEIRADLATYFETSP